MHLNNYKALIQAMPILDQAFLVKAKNWEKQLSPEDFRYIFRGQPHILLSREDVFLTNRIDFFIIKTILWGYPAGMRGNHFSSIYNSLADISAILNRSDRMELNFEDLSNLQTAFRAFPGLGLSTYTKFLQLRGFRFDGVPALILDERIIRVFKNKVFDEFQSLSNITEYNKESHYAVYLKCMHECAQQLETTPEHLELFLFTFGNNLKSN